MNLRLPKHRKHDTVRDRTEQEYKFSKKIHHFEIFRIFQNFWTFTNISMYILKQSSRPIRLVVGSLSRDAIGLGYEFGSYSVESRSVVLIVNECDILRRRSDVVLELSKADVADFNLTEFH